MKGVGFVGEAIAEPAHDDLKAAYGQRHVRKICRIRFPERAELSRRGRQQIEKDRFDGTALGQQLINIGSHGTVIVSERQCGELLNRGRRLLFGGF